MNVKDHWDNVYRTRRSTEVSWFQPVPATSLSLIERAAKDRTAAIIDVGAGASRLVATLLEQGYRRISILDVSAEALSISRAQLGDAGDSIEWILGDVTNAELPHQAFDIWHDRAVFHFLTAPEDRQRYVMQVQRTLRNGGHAVIATFADDGPLKCSGLNVARYSAEQLSQEFGSRFALVESRHEQHVTPSGVYQSFVYCLFRFNAGM